MIRSFSLMAEQKLYPVEKNENPFFNGILIAKIKIRASKIFALLFGHFHSLDVTNETFYQLIQHFFTMIA